VPVGRAVGHEQDLAAGLGEALDHLLAPDVLADGQAEAQAAQVDRPRQGAGGEDALLVEDTVIGQVHLEAHGGDGAGVKHRIGVVDLAVLVPRQADEDGRAAVGRVAGQLLAGPAAGVEEGGAQHKILRRIAGKVELGEHHDIRPHGGGFCARLARLGEIGRDVAHDGVELGEREAEAVDGCRHASDLARADRPGNGGEGRRNAPSRQPKR